MSYTLEPIGYIRTCFPEKFGIPRQPLLAPSAKGVLQLLPPFNHPDCVKGLEQSSHIWLSFIFHQHIEQGWKSTVRPPRLGGNEKLGVFATRTSFRPNHLGLSVAALDKVHIDSQGVQLYFSGIDLLDGTPIVDIKPYLHYADSLPDAVNRWAPQAPEHTDIIFSEEAEAFCAAYCAHHSCAGALSQQVDLKQLIIEVLQQDPRPAYHQRSPVNESREYGMALLDCNIVWECVADSYQQKTMMRVNRITQV